MAGLSLGETLKRQTLPSYIRLHIGSRQYQSQDGRSDARGESDVFRNERWEHEDQAMRRVPLNQRVIQRQLMKF